MKTALDYLDDPRIANDLELISGTEEARTIRAIRLKHQDETAGMTIEGKLEFHRRKTDTAFATLGLPPPQYANLTGQGKISPKAALSV